MPLPYSARPLPPRPSLDQYRKQAKELLAAHAAGDSDALEKFQRYLPRAAHLSAAQVAALGLTLADAQWALAREHGFDTWAAFKRYVEALTPATDGLLETFKRLVNDRDAAGLRALARDRPDVRALVNEPLFAFDAPAIVSVSWTQDRATFDALLEAGADVHAKSRWWAGAFDVFCNATDPAWGEFVLSRGAKLTAHAAAGLGRADDLKAMLARDPALARQRFGDGQTPLHVARTPEVADLLLAAGAEIGAPCVDHGGTPVQYAVPTRPDVAEHLLARGAAADVFLHVALGHLETVRALITTDRSLLALQTCTPATVPHPAPGDHIYAYTLWRNATPLMIAARVDRLDMAALLLDLGADPNAVGHGTALHVAAWQGHLDMARLLVERGASPKVTDPDHQGTPLDWARHNKQADLVAYLQSL